ncbi:hypothetical protein HanRHA438_Chr13g0602381 [Helianthus annuus]|nr:hypothetical protein HanIR_Chr13g0643881 [Helianthus annuus]KAJ0858563.1 hypothetical protein HanRHA438_Chr13g0602381 [Helianthus annuus]
MAAILLSFNRALYTIDAPPLPISSLKLRDAFFSSLYVNRLNPVDTGKYICSVVDECLLLQYQKNTIQRISMNPIVIPTTIMNSSGFVLFFFSYNLTSGVTTTGRGQL